MATTDINSQPPNTPASLVAPIPLGYARPGTTKPGVDPRNVAIAAWGFAIAALSLMFYRLDSWLQRIDYVAIYIVPPVLVWVGTRRRPIRWLRTITFVVCISWMIYEAIHRINIIYGDPNHPRSRWRAELVEPSVNILWPPGIYVAVRCCIFVYDGVRRRARSNAEVRQ